jgi:hypothetical protein
VNGIKGIATGYACDIPPHDPVSVIDALVDMCDGKTPRDIAPKVPGCDCEIRYNFDKHDYIGKYNVIGANQNAGNVYGLQLGGVLNLGGEEKKIAGVQLAGGVNNAPDADLYGAQAGLWNAACNVIGVQIGAANRNPTESQRVYGIQAGAIFNANLRCDGLAGIQAAAIVNYEPETVTYGVQAALCNMTKESYGVQAGVVNLTHDVYGLQIGTILNSTSDCYGVQLATANYTLGDVSGLQIGAIFNANMRRSKVSGAQLSSILNYSPDARVNGLQLSLINDAYDFSGLQLGLVNVSEDLAGVQIGLINLSGRVDGAQIGLINKAERMNGFQIGLLNVISSKDITVLPLVNVQF